MAAPGDGRTDDVEIPDDMMRPIVKCHFRQKFSNSRAVRSKFPRKIRYFRRLPLEFPWFFANFMLRGCGRSCGYRVVAMEALR